MNLVSMTLLQIQAKLQVCVYEKYQQHNAFSRSTFLVTILRSFTDCSEFSPNWVTRSAPKGLQTLNNLLWHY